MPALYAAQVSTARGSSDLGSHHDRADSPHNQKQDKRHRHDKFHTRRGPDACTAASPSQCKVVKRVDCFLVQNRGSPDVRHFFSHVTPGPSGSGSASPGFFSLQLARSRAV